MSGDEFDEQEWHRSGCPTMESAFIGLKKKEADVVRLNQEVARLNQRVGYLQGVLRGNRVSFDENYPGV